MKLFEVFVREGSGRDQVISPEVIEQTGAQVFSQAEADFVGLEGIPDDPEGRERLFIACSPTDARFITTRLEGNEAVAGFKLHEMR